MTATPIPLVAGNWKMNGLRDDGVALARGLAERARETKLDCDIALCPPATLLFAVARVLGGKRSRIALGGQDCAARPAGAHTGDVGAPMLADAGCRYVIVGHSERRGDHGESSATVRAKAEAAVAAGLTPIVCVGETERQHDAGRTWAVVRRQLSQSLPAVGDFVIAYEPVWAIGTGRTPTIAEVAEVHGRIRGQLRRRMGRPAAGVRLLYGGSVKPANADALMAIPDVDGGLIGGASLNADDFWSICNSCAAAKGGAAASHKG